MITSNAVAAMRDLRENLAVKLGGANATLTTFKSGSAMLDVRRDGLAWVMVYSPKQGFGVDELHGDDGFTTGYRFVSEEFEPAARRLRDLARAERTLLKPSLALLVVHATDIEKTQEFYAQLGLAFSEEKHGSGPRHYAAVLNGCVFEIYPCLEAQAQAPFRIGFCVAEIDETLRRLRSQGTRVLSEPKDSPWGRRAVVEDPDGNRVELSAVRPSVNQ